LSKGLLRTHGQGHEDVAFPLRSGLDGVDWVLGAPAVALDRAARIVRDANGRDHQYDALVIATGLSPKPLPIPDHGLGGIRVLRTLEDAVGLREVLTPGTRVVILGSGFIGCEIAATAAHAGAEVSIVTQSRVPLERALGPILGAELLRRHEAHGVRFYLAATPFAPLPSFWSDQYDANLLAFGMTYLADRSELVAGTPDTECVAEYFRGENLVGVCGIGMRSAVQSYRSRFVVPVA